MKAKVFSGLRKVTVWIAVCTAVSALAAPLTWFPGPSLDWPVSGAAATPFSGGGIMVIGGDSYGSPNYYPELLLATNQSWTVEPGMSATVAGGAVGAGGQVLYFGGTDGTSSQSTALNYSPSDGTTAANSMTTARSYFGYVGDSSGNAYAFGGLDANGNALASAESCNQDSGTWSATTSLPVALYNFPAVFDHTNQIYIFGGYTNASAGTEVNTVRKFSTHNHTWTTLASMPVATAGSVAAYGADGQIYVVGGLSSGVPVDTVQVYNPSANSWTISTPIPEALSASVMGVDTEGRLVVAGGLDVNTNEVTDVWRSQQLGTTDSPPALTQFPTTTAVYNGAYASTIAATGNPQPVYLLVNGPAGMTVDYYSGAVSWTPQGLDQIGSLPVTIAVTNYAGVTNWSFDISVPHPPPTTPTNIQEISFNDTSATISWSPQDPSVGPVTYRIAIRHPYAGAKGSSGGVNYQTILTNITTNVITLSGAPSSSTALALSVTASNGTTVPYGYATWFSATTSGPQGPTALLLTALTSTSASIDWAPSLGPAQNAFFSPVISYSVMEETGPPLTTFPVVQNIIGTNASMTGLTPGATYYISGVDAQGTYSPLDYATTWTMPIPKPAALAGHGFLAGGGFQFAITPASASATVSQTTLVQATTNLADPTSWTTIYTNPVGGAPYSFTDPDAAAYPARYYRVVSP